MSNKEHLQSQAEHIKISNSQTNERVVTISRNRFAVLLCGLISLSGCDRPSIQEAVDYYTNGEVQVELNLNNSTEQTDKNEPVIPKEKLPQLTETDKMHLRDNPGAIYEEQNGNVLCGRNQIPIIDKKLYTVTVDGITFKMRRAEDVTEDEKFVEIKLCDKTKLVRKVYADLLEKAQNCMAEEYSDYTNKRRSWLWRRGYWGKMKALASTGSMTCLEADDASRTNEEQEKSYQSSLVKDANGNVVMENGKPKQSFVVAKGCFSFHLSGLATDIDNWGRAQSCLWKEGIAGGSRGIDKDARHFSIKEFNNAGLLRAAKNRGRALKNKLKRRR